MRHGLEAAVARAEEAVRGAVAGPATAPRATAPRATDASASGLPASAPDAVGPSGDAAGTTLTAMLWTGSQLALVHVGDSRAYLLRDGALFQITHDHTLVQNLIDEGRLTPEEAATHPQRTLLARALAGDGTDVMADTCLRDAVPGDRYLLCSDGLSAVVPTAAVRQVLTATGTPERAARELVALANGNGGPDNVSCVVADVVEAARQEAAREEVAT